MNSKSRWRNAVSVDGGVGEGKAFFFRVSTSQLRLDTTLKKKVEELKKLQPISEVRTLSQQLEEARGGVAN